MSKILRTCHTSYSSEHRSSSNHRVQARGNAIVRAIAFAVEDPQVRIPECQLLHANPHDPPGNTSQTQTRYEQSAGDFHAEGENGCYQFQHERQNKQKYCSINSGTRFGRCGRFVRRDVIHVDVIAGKYNRDFEGISLKRSILFCR